MTSPRPSTIVFAIDGPVARDELPGLCNGVKVLLECGGAEVALCDVGALAAGAVTVEALARIQLTARRLGGEIRLRHVPDELLELLAFMGLTDVLGVQPSRQAEEREQRLGVEEERKLDDPSR